MFAFSKTGGDPFEFVKERGLVNGVSTVGVLFKELTHFGQILAVVGRNQKTLYPWH